MAFSSSTNHSDDALGRGRLVQVFRYLQALNERRNPARWRVEEQEWALWLADLPQHPSVRLGTFDESDVDAASPTDEESFSASAEPFLRVGRAETTEAPTLPALLRPWVRSNGSNPDKAPEYHATRSETRSENESVSVRWEDDAERVRVGELYRRQWEVWAEQERPARASRRLFERLYALHAQLEREGERFEMVLGDGLLQWRPEGGGAVVQHPVLLQRLQLVFEPRLPEFQVVEAERPPELYSGLLRALLPLLPAATGAALARWRQAVENEGIHPLGGETTNDFLRELATQLSPNGEFVSVSEPAVPDATPRLMRQPVVFLRRRTLGHAAALEAILDDLPTRTDLPAPLLSIVGRDVPCADSLLEEAGLASLSALEGGDDVLLSKPANPEQRQIARRLDRHGAVLVQGPPGTGKTHTIANLIGHLLAQGKSVLVTSHTTKALRVLHGQIPDELKPLCVSVLDSDADSRKALESAAGGIVERLNRGSDATQLDAEAAETAGERAALLARRAQTLERLQQARRDEYRDVAVGEAAVYTPSDAARAVAAGQQDGHDWIPGPTALGAPVPLSAGELVELYRTNATVTPQDEQELRAAPLPALNALASPTDFGLWARERAALEGEERGLRADLWQPSNDAPAQVSALGDLLVRLQSADRTLENAVRSPGWRSVVLEAGRQGGPYRQPWDDLVAQIKALCDQAVRAQPALWEHSPAFTETEDADAQIASLEEMIAHLQAGKSLSALTRLLHPAWKRLLPRFRVGSRTPQRVPEFEALLTLARLQQARRRLCERWDAQMASTGDAPASKECGDAPETSLRQFCRPIQDALDWHANVWETLERDMAAQGFDWPTLLREEPPQVGGGEQGELRRLFLAAQRLPALFASRERRLRWDSIERSFHDLRRVLDYGSGGEDERLFGAAPVALVLRQAVADRDPDAYRRAWERLAALHERRADLSRRHELLGRLEKTAPAWAAAIRDRQPPHDKRDLPGDAAQAWLWRQLFDELEARAQTSLPALGQELARLTDSIQQATSVLVNQHTWAAQLRRVKSEQRQALQGWVQIMRRYGAGKGKRAARYLTEARRLMAECQTAVPVWIMPLSRVVENYDPRTTRFDVVIIDEASQCDVMGLIALYLGRQVVVVGDHEQVSPDAVGERIDDTDRLIDEHLQDIPNAVLYDGQQSVYDLATRAFGGAICLREHFRCVPDIIQFSNHLSYEGRVKPLRDAASQSTLLPHVVVCRVEEATAAVNKVNEAEARTVASLLAAAVEQPEYARATFGVVSLVGDEQAQRIEALLRNCLSPVDYEKRRIVCGNAAQFQGDERDVMFLSVVDASDGSGPLSLRGAGPREMYKKRFNVAASRARDQMWVVHSLDPATDLKAGDLRRRLIEHAQNPADLSGLLAQGEPQTPSDFEQQVCRCLVDAGYRVTAQRQVGAYRIGLVIEGTRLAVECDGDRYDALERLDTDLERQAVLERLGWKFVRVRGSVYFRDPERALRPVFERLAQLGITPTQPQTSSESTGSAQGKSGGHDALEQRVLRRAAALRRAWNGDAPAPKPAAESATVPAHNDKSAASNATAQPVETTPKERGTNAAQILSSNSPVLEAHEPEGKAAQHRVPSSFARPAPSMLPSGIASYQRAHISLVGGEKTVWGKTEHDKECRREFLKRLVEAEGPVSLETAAQRLSAAAGIPAANFERVRQITGATASALVTAGEVKRHGDFLWLAGMERPQARAAKPASEPPRSWHEISPEETAEAVWLLLQSAQSISNDDLLTQTAFLFGLSSTDAEARDQFGQAVACLELDGRLRRLGTHYVPIQ